MCQMLLIGQDEDWELTIEFSNREVIGNPDKGSFDGVVSRASVFELSWYHHTLPNL